MRTLVISDLHLGSRLHRDVLRRPAALDALCAELDVVDRLVLLGDTVEMLEGRPKGALEDAEPVLRAMGDALGPDTDVILLPGNHDHALVRPWLRERRTAGKALGLSDRVPLRSNPDLQRIARWLKPARVQVRYPGVELGDGIWAHHGHYLDRHLVRQPQVPSPATPEDYERALGTSIAALGAVMAASLPPIIGEPIDRVASLIRLVGVAALPIADALPGSGLLAPLSAGALGFQFRRVGLPAMAAVNARLGVEAEHVLFGHLHRSGPRPADDPGEWGQGTEQQLWNSGCWVYEPLLLAGASPPHPYWPGGALRIEDGKITVRGLLDDVDPAKLR